MFLEKIRRDNYLAQISRTQRNFRNKREKKIIKKPLDPKEAQDNIVYRVLKKQKDTDAIINFIIDQGEIRKPKRVSSNYPRSKTVIFDGYNRKNNHQINGRNKSYKSFLSFQEKAFGIVIDSRKVYYDLDRSKKRIKILDKFNKKIGKYCSYLPDNPQETRNQSNIANQQLRILCNHNFFPSDNLHKRAFSLMHYQEPKIPFKKFKLLKSKFTTNKPTAAISSDTQPMQRLLTVQF